MSLAGWDESYKRKLTFDSSLVDEDLTDFVVPVLLNVAAGKTGFDMSAVFDALEANSNKIAFEIGNTGVQCYGEVVEWDDASKTAHIDIKVPSVAAASNSFLNFYYDPAHADNTTYIGDTNSTPSDQVHSDRAFVSHQAQDPTGSILDSSPNAKHGTSYGSMTSGDLIDGLTSKAIDYDGTDDYTNHGYDAAHDITDALTIRAVIKPSITLDSGLTDYPGIVSRQHDDADSESTYALVFAPGGELVLGAGGGGLFSTKNSWASGETFVIHATYTSIGPTGDLFVDGVEETLSQNTVGTLTGSTNNLVLGKNRDTLDFFPGAIDEVLVINAVMSDAWVKADNAALRDNLITFSEISTSVPISAFFDMSYGDMQLRAAFFDQYYSLKLGTMLSMYYGDNPALQAIFKQYYGDNPLLKKIFDMPYGQLLQLRHAIDMPYLLPKALQQHSDMLYSMTGEKLQAVLEQPFNLLENDLLMKLLNMPYMLMLDSALSRVGVSVSIGGQAVDPFQLNIEASIDSFVISCELKLSSEAEYLGIELGMEAEVVVNSDTYAFIVESRVRKRSGIANTVYQIELVSPAQLLEAPWSDQITCVFDADTASNIIDLVAGQSVDMSEFVDFPVLKDSLYANNETRIDIIRRLKDTVGAMVQSNPDGTMRIIPEYPVAVNQWADATPDYFLTDARNFISQDETFKHNTGYNIFEISDQLTPDERIWTEVEGEDDYEKRVLGFQVPWDDNLSPTLEATKCGSADAPRYIGELSFMSPPLDEEPEQVEFVAGFASTSRPIYGKFSVTCVGDDHSLGEITWSEDGTLEAENKHGVTEGYGLMEVRYETKCHLWIVTDANNESIQYIMRAEVEEGEEGGSCS